MLEISGIFCAAGKDLVKKKINGSQRQASFMGTRTLSSSS